MNTIKKSRPANFAQDMKDLDNIANAYNTCSDGFRDTWKQKWYEMVEVIAKRVQTVDKSRRH
jgi:hypothetical protein